MSAWQEPFGAHHREPAVPAATTSGQWRVMVFPAVG